MPKKKVQHKIEFTLLVDLPSQAAKLDRKLHDATDVYMVDLFKIMDRVDKKIDDPDRNEFYASDTENITGVKRLRLRTWLEAGYLKPPDYRGGGGSGIHNVFTRADLYLIALFKHLVENGFSRELASAYGNFEGIRDMRLDDPAMKYCYLVAIRDPA